MGNGGHVFNSQDYTDKAWEAITSLTEIANEFDSSYVEGDMLLYALVNGNDDVVTRVLTNVGIDPENLKKELENHLRKQIRMSGSFGDRKILGRILENVLNISKRYKSEFGVCFTYIYIYTSFIICNFFVIYNLEIIFHKID